MATPVPLTHWASLTPVTRWVGGKRRLAPTIAGLFPDPLDIYLEPFCGAAAVFGHIYGRVREWAELNDANADMIRTFQAIRRSPLPLGGELERMRQDYAARSMAEREILYYEVRDAWNAGKRGAAAFLFLKATSFNGLWRVNGDGLMNAAWGKLEAPAIVPADLMAWLDALQKVALRHGDWMLSGYKSLFWHPVIPGKRVGVFFDPPYLGTFDGYTSEGFEFPVRMSLYMEAARLAQRGARVVIAESAEALPHIKAAWPTAHIVPVKDSRRINVDGADRAEVNALLAVGGHPEGVMS
jgi:DNA adenine methylase